MNILLTGSEGFTGKHFSNLASSAGHLIHSCKANICDFDGIVEEICRIDFDYVVHLAAISYVGHTDERAFYDVNLFGTLNLLNALIKAKNLPKKILIASSANIYGNNRLPPISEEASPAPVNHYATSKLAMEHMVSTFSERLPITIVRPFNYTGVGQSQSFLMPKLVHHFAERLPKIELGNLDVEREFNDVRMVCDAYLRLLESGANNGTYNICSGRPYSINEVISRLSMITEHTLDICVNPEFVRRSEVLTLFGNPEKLVKAIGYLDEIPLEETLSWMLAN